MRGIEKKTFVLEAPSGQKRIAKGFTLYIYVVSTLEHAYFCYNFPYPLISIFNFPSIHPFTELALFSLMRLVQGFIQEWRITARFIRNNKIGGKDR